MGKFYTSGFLLLCFLFIETLQLCWCQNSGLGCIEKEREALLKFKHSLQDPALWLSSWTGTDCCKWKGVSCSPSNGHVVKLDLRRTNSDYNWFGSQLMDREVNSCLLELRYLNYLDLSGINFQGTPIPKFFGLMKPLRYLNLSGTRFSGMVPSQLGNLTNLHVLALNSPRLYVNSPGFYPAPTIENVEWVSHLLSLHHLDMSFIDLGGALMQVLNRLPSLLVLRLYRCGLYNTHLSQAYVNSTFLSTVQYLDLGDNSFEGPFPHVLQNMTSLRVLDLTGNHFNSSIPLWLGNFKSLVYLDLSFNEFNSIEGGLSMILWNHCHLKSLYLSFNYQLSGES